MSYDLAVREGERPADDRPAGRAFTDLFDRCLDSEVGHPPTERIAAYVAALVERRGDVTEDLADASPWAAGPLIGGAGGPIVYFPMSWSRAEEASARAAALADSMGLVQVSATALRARGIESSTRLGRHGRSVERTVSWPAGCRRLYRRCERKAEHFLARRPGSVSDRISPPDQERQGLSRFC